MANIGLDMDGVLADFNSAYIELVVQESGKDLFPERPFPITTWGYPKTYGYTHADESKAWEVIKQSNFWFILDAYPGVDDFLKNLYDLDQVHAHHFYFITSRVGKTCKVDTEDWLYLHGFKTPTVLISSEKGECAHALNLDLYIDDKNENCQDVVRQSPATRCFMFARPWNAPQEGVTRTVDLGDFEEVIRERA